MGDIQKYDGRAFLLEEIPSGYGKEHLQDHLEGVLDRDIQQIRQNSCRADIFLVIFEEPVTDLKDFRQQLRETDPPLNQLVLKPLQFESAVLLQDIDFEIVTEQLLTDCIQVIYANGEEVITSWEYNSKLGYAVVRFHHANDAVAERMLAGGKFNPLPFDKPDYIVPSEPYFEAFHAIIVNPLVVSTSLGNEAAQKQNSAQNVEVVQEDLSVQSHATQFNVSDNSLVKLSQEGNLDDNQTKRKDSTEDVTVSAKGFTDHDLRIKNDYINDHEQSQFTEATQFEDMQVKEIVKDSDSRPTSDEYFSTESGEYSQVESTLEKHSTMTSEPVTKEIEISQLKADVLSPQIIEVDKNIKKTFQKTGLEAVFYQKHLKEKIYTLSSSNVKIEQQFVSGQQKFTVTLTGKFEEVEKVFAQISKLSDNVFFRGWQLQEEFEENDLWLLSKSLQDLRIRFESFQSEHQCLIFMNIPKPEENSETSQGKTFSSKPRGATTLEARHFATPNLPQKARDILFSSVARPECKVHVKSYGDVTKEQSDILVCVLTERKDLRRTRVGQAFNSLCPNLWTELKDKVEAHPSDSVIVTSTSNGNVACQSIIHVVLKPWDPNNSQNCETELRKIIKKVLNIADNILQVQSISFPVMGSGLAFKFPPAVVAKAMLESVSDHLQNAKGSLTNIVLLAPDAELSTEFEKCKNIPRLSLIQEDALSTGQFNAFKVMDHGEEVQAKKDDDDDASQENENDGGNESYKFRIQDQFSSSTVFIIAITDCSELWKKMKVIIRDYCLYTDYFNQEEIQRWPKNTRCQIESEAEKHCVVVGFSKHPHTQFPGVVIKGKKEDVTKVKTFIRHKFQKLTQYLPKARLNSTKAPERGTENFLKYAASSDKPFPSYWMQNQSNSWSLNPMKWWHGKTETDILKNVDDKIFQSIKDLIEKTWEAQKVGFESDGQFSYKQLQLRVESIQRVENRQLFEKYSVKRKCLLQRGTLCPDIGQIRGSKGPVKTTEILDSHMKSELYYEINEHYLFHGFKGTAKEIAWNGLDAKVGYSSGMFGRGIYFAESSTKADEYSDERGQQTTQGTKLTMVLSRVLLGNVFLCDHNLPTAQAKDLEKLTGPPSTYCLKDLCPCNQPHFDSVMGDGKRLFREFVVYDSALCYPEYLISYIREWTQTQN